MNAMRFLVVCMSVTAYVVCAGAVIDGDQVLTPAIFAKMRELRSNATVKVNTRCFDAIVFSVERAGLRYVYTCTEGESIGRTGSSLMNCRPVLHDKNPAYDAFLEELAAVTAQQQNSAPAPCAEQIH